MGERTGIAWTDSTWNPVRGCSRVSEGCRNCYAEKVAGRFGGAGRPFEGFVKYRSKASGLTYDNPKAAGTAEALWTGKVALVEKALLLPLHWREPRRIFVNSMSDLFHESLPDEAIDRVFAVMALAPRHTFQILTKRPERMRRYIADPIGPVTRGRLVAQGAAALQESLAPGRGHFQVSWPLPNVWLGVSTEDQRTADERIPLLLQTPAAVRFISAEPLLGAVELTHLRCNGNPWSALHPSITPDTIGDPRRLDWVITGGESGPGARPCDIAWIRSIVGQCKAAGVPCFVKQLGSRCGYPSGPGNLPAVSGLVGRLPVPDAEYLEDRGDGWHCWGLRDRKGADPAEWPEDLRVQEFPR